MYRMKETKTQTIFDISQKFLLHTCYKNNTPFYLIPTMIYVNEKNINMELLKISYLNFVTKFDFVLPNDICVQ